MPEWSRLHQQAHLTFLSVEAEWRHETLYEWHSFLQETLFVVLSQEQDYPFCKVVFFPDEEVTAFSVCDISPPQYSNRDRFAENTTVFWNQRLESCDDDRCWRTNHVWLQPFNVILIMKWLKSRKCLNQDAGPGRDRLFLACRVSAPEIPHTSGKRGLPSPPGSLLPCFVGQSYLHHCISPVNIQFT